MQTAEGFAPVFFDPRPLTNLLLIDELDSLSPVLDMQVFCCLVASVLPCFYSATSECTGEQQAFTTHSSQGQGTTVDSCNCAIYYEADAATSCVILTLPEAALWLLLYTQHVSAYVGQSHRREG